MSNLGAMRDRIASELGDRTDLNTNIVAAIQSAIKFYENTPLWFNEEEDTTDTVAGIASYALPENFIELTSVTVDTGNGDQCELKRIPQEAMRSLELTSDGEPRVFSIYREELKLYPTPNDTFELTLCYLRELDDISAISDTNAWMVEGEELIRMHAKQDVRMNVLQLPENADWTRREDAVLRRLKDRTRQMVATGSLQTTEF